MKTPLLSSNKGAPIDAEMHGGADEVKEDSGEEIEYNGEEEEVEYESKDVELSEYEPEVTTGMVAPGADEHVAVVSDDDGDEDDQGVKE
ncbi:hypothetical protein BGZ80_010903 [Entomortierella chlamydospora]|uniref:Uncharacterized protein n=1 Tax=Entomortierella chlamydospora TaxID=101097 RepID=A0A9P6T3V0_9FUNG|nr:hypothetical protein BGZ80_010903 [Entomortierella chlamydospora]